jgi:hypothetical protein
MNETQLPWKDTPDTFSMLEDVAHVRDLELDATTSRIRRILCEDAPELENFDGTAVAVVSRYNDESLYAVLTALRLARCRNVEILRRLDSGAFSRWPTMLRESLSLIELPKRLRDHDAEHLAALVAIARCQQSA